MRTIYSLNTLGWHFGRKNVGAPDTVSPWQDVVLPHVWNKDDPKIGPNVQKCRKRRTAH